MAQRKKHGSVRSRTNKAASRATLRRVDEDATSSESYAEMTMAQIRAAIDVVNQSRPADNLISKRGRKADLVELLAAADRNIPLLPSHPPKYTDDGEAFPVEWHAQTGAWWNDVWTSPMAQEWDESDLHNVFVVALLYDDIWTASTPRARQQALAEYRLQRADLGLSPYARRRLEWAFETADEAKARGDKRRSTGRTPVEHPKKGDGSDPRAHLIAVP